jgi:hypothetical protein
LPGKDPDQGLGVAIPFPPFQTRSANLKDTCWNALLALEARRLSDQAGPERQDSKKPLHGPYWEMPGLLGEAEALNSMGTIAAPLLAGFSLAAMVQTLTITASDTRWPAVPPLLFLLASVLFVAAVQAMFWARGYQTSPPEITAWWPDADRPERMELLRKDQQWHAAGFRMWANRARVAYSLALLCLLAALTILAVPAKTHGQELVLRWLAVAVGGGALLAETIWIMVSFTNPKWMAWFLEPKVGEPQDSSSGDPDK